jgi:hypothetical protein
MKLNNSIINQIFADAGIKNHRLLNKHHSQYTEMDIMVLESIKMGKKVKNNYYIPKKDYTLKKVLRKSDGVIFESVADCAEKTGMTKQQIYNYINNQKYSENKQLVYLYEDDDE